MPPDITRFKPPIDKYLREFLQKQKENLGRINQWGTDAIDRLTPFVTSGKSVRGCLVLFAFKAFGGKRLPDVVPAAAAIELVHTALLIHDDIMDRDDKRREKDTLWRQYQVVAEKLARTDPLHSGYSMGINVGNLAIFLAYDLLQSIKIDSLLKKKLTKLFSQELANVTIAQMQDVMAVQPSEREIRQLYRYKTACYTFSLPLIIGAILTKQTSRVVAALAKLGEFFGLIYQLKDDELGLIGDPAQTGKPLGADFREKRQTYLSFVLRNQLKQPDSWRFETIMKKDALTDKDIQTIQFLYKTSGTKEVLKRKMIGLESQAKKLIQNLSISGPHKASLVASLHFCRVRTK